MAIFGYKLWGKTRIVFLTLFFSSVCTFVRKTNRPKFYVGQISKYVRVFPKKFFRDVSQLFAINYGVHGTNPIRDLVKFYTRRRHTKKTMQQTSPTHSLFLTLSSSARTLFLNCQECRNKKVNTKVNTYIFK